MLVWGRGGGTAVVLMGPEVSGGGTALLVQPGGVGGGSMLVWGRGGYRCIADGIRVCVCEGGVAAALLMGPQGRQVGGEGG